MLHHTGYAYFCPGKRSHQFRFFYAFSFTRLGNPHGTDRRTGKVGNAAYYDRRAQTNVVEADVRPVVHDLVHDEVDHLIVDVAEAVL